MGAKVPQNESSREWKFPRTFVPGSERAREWIGHRANGCQSTRHRSTRHPVDSSCSWLVTKRRSTRHKQTNKQTSKPYCRSSNYP